MYQVLPTMKALFCIFGFSQLVSEPCRKYIYVSIRQKNEFTTHRLWDSFIFSSNNYSSYFVVLLSATFAQSPLEL